MAGNSGSCVEEGRGGGGLFLSFILLSILNFFFFTMCTCYYSFQE